MVLTNFIKSVPDFPQTGILFRDIQPLLQDPDAFDDAVFKLGKLVDLSKVDYFIGIESRGFIFASALAVTNKKGLKLIRKKGKLPPNNLSKLTYTLEYGSDTIEMEKGYGNVVLVDDVFATGGTMAAAEILAELSGYQVVDSICLLDIGIVKQHDTKCVISY